MSTDAWIEGSSRGDSAASLPTRPERGVAADFGRDLLLTIGFGVWVAAAVLALFAATRRFDSTISMSWLRTNRHAYWMVPAGTLLAFAALGLIQAALARVVPAIRGRNHHRILIGAGALACLLEIEGLYAAAAVVLAIGLGLRFGPALETAVRARPRGLAAATIALALALGGFGIVEGRRVLEAEARAIAALPAADPAAKNVLLIVLDNVRASSMSLYGRERPTTPEIERLARRGVVFRRARSTSSWTLPTHASLLTGRWCHELDFDFDRALGSQAPTLAEILAARGYASAGFVANTFYGNACYGLARGFARYQDHYENEEVSLFETARSTALGKRILAAAGVPIRVEQGASRRKTGAMIRRDFADWLDSRPADRPFFALLNFYDAHAPFTIPTPDTPRFGRASLPIEEQAATLRAGFAIAPGSPLTVEEAEKRRRAAAEVRLDSYESCLASLDREIGRLFADLERRGLADETVIVLTSDHGEHFAERGYYGHGLSLYEPEIHVPLVLFAPGLPGAGGVVEQPVSLRNIAATILDLLGDPVRGALPGESLAGLGARDASESPTAGPVLAELGRRRNLEPTPLIPTSVGPLRAVVVGGAVLIRNGDGREELYDLATDPTQRLNRIDDPASRTRAERLRATLAAFETGVWPPLETEGDRSSPEPEHEHRIAVEPGDGGRKVR
ncbi:MAG: sulfatase [Isosphaeraceae bacterium]|nr:sulfatase [Isosphaeraceae bacterium]